MNTGSLEAGKLFGVENVIAVVTGGGTGIGFMIANALAQNGAKKVYVVGRRKDALENAKRQAALGNIVPVVADITKRSDLKTLADQIRQDCGRVDILVNNAGVMKVRHKSLPLASSDSMQDLQNALWDEEDSGWAEQFRVNVTAAYFTTVAFLDLLHESGKFWSRGESSSVPKPQRLGQVITVNGIAAHSRNMANCMGYSASKAAALHLMKTMSTVLAQKDIRFNMLSPGVFPTEMTAGKGDLDDDNRNHLGPLLRTECPQRHAGSEEDIAGAILFLCGRSGWYCNGVEIITDGGRLSIAPSTY